jgi:hypothetical protein
LLSELSLEQRGNGDILKVNMKNSNEVENANSKRNLWNWIEESSSVMSYWLNRWFQVIQCQREIETSSSFKLSTMFSNLKASKRPTFLLQQSSITPKQSPLQKLRIESFPQLKPKASLNELGEKFNLHFPQHKSRVCVFL